MVQMFTAGVRDGIKKKVPFVLEHSTGLVQLVEELTMKGKMPDTDWLLVLLAKVPGKSCPIFAKGYVPPARPAPTRIEMKLDNRDGFWTGLQPVSKLAQGKAPGLDCLKNLT